jgi:hypothetical protein
LRGHQPMRTGTTNKIDNSSRPLPNQPHQNNTTTPKLQALPHLPQRHLAPASNMYPPPSLWPLLTPWPGC